MNTYDVTAIILNDQLEVTLTCENCGTGIIIRSLHGLGPEQCPSCHKVFEEAIRTGLKHFFDFCRDAKNAKSRIEIAVWRKVPIRRSFEECVREFDEGKHER